MAFTVDEERILRLIIDELRIRKKLDAARKLRDLDLRTEIAEAQTEVDKIHASTIATLQVDFNAAEQAIIDEFA